VEPSTYLLSSSPSENLELDVVEWVRDIQFLLLLQFHCSISSVSTLTVVYVWVCVLSCSVILYC
jgi:hypothetical protein